MQILSGFKVVSAVTVALEFFKEGDDFRYKLDSEGLTKYDAQDVSLKGGVEVLPSSWAGRYGYMLEDRQGFDLSKAYASSRDNWDVDSAYEEFVANFKPEYQSLWVPL